LLAYIINMDSAVERWAHVEPLFAQTGIPYQRISGVNGRKLQFPIAEFDERLYRRCHGKQPNAGQIGCYLSHIRALDTFLDSKQEFGIICEDDINPVRNLGSLVEEATAYRDDWDILRLCGFHNGHPRPMAQLSDGYSIVVNFTRLCGTGAYMVSRHAAQVLRKALVPMWLPIDHALDREWAYGLSAASIYPLPVSQVDHAFASQTTPTKDEKLPAWKRYWTVFPYRASNEIKRFIARGRQLRRARTGLAA
jgi:glycosyl transferase, family 25